VIGGGGRRACLVWKLGQKRPGGEDLVRTGKWWHTEEGGVRGQWDAGIVGELVALGTKRLMKPDLTVVGPELPPGERIGGRLRTENSAGGGPDKKAAQRERHQDLAKEFLQRHIFRQRNCTVAHDSAGRRVRGAVRGGWPVGVIKADGCARERPYFVAPDPETRGDGFF